MRRSSFFLSVIGTGLLALGLSVVDSWVRGTPDASRVRAGALVRDLGLTDLALSTEARYTRHRALADRHSAFQEHPLALDHFPSGSLLGPPPHLRSR
jgi:hypothetical protein